MTRLIRLSGVVINALILPLQLFAQPPCDGSITLTTLLDAFHDPSFEAITQCPDEISRMDLNLHWVQVNYGTSDQYDFCGNAISHWELPLLITPIPNGTAFLGGLSLFTSQGYVEGFGTTLLQPLTGGQRYELRGFVQLGTESDEFDPLETLTLSAYGSYQTNVLPYSGYGCPPASLGFLEIGQVTATGYGWVEFTMIIEPTVLINTFVLIPSCGSNGQGYFYLDALSIFEVEEVEPELTIDLVGDCETGFELVATDHPGYDYEWYKDGQLLGTMGSVHAVSPGSEGRYQVVLMHSAGSGCVTSATDVAFPTFLTVIDTTICEGDGIEIGSLYFDEPGSFEVMLNTSAGCDSVVQLNLDVVPYAELSFAYDSIYCFGDTTLVTTTTGNDEAYNVAWPDGNADWIRQIPGGDYSVTVTAQPSGCLTQSSFTIPQPDPIQPLVLIRDVSCPDGADGVINFIGSGGVGDYRYQLDDRTVQIGDSASYGGLPPQDYSVQVVDGNGCIFDSVVRVEVPESLDLRIVIPQEALCLQEPFNAYLTVEPARLLDEFEWELNSLLNWAGVSIFYGPEVEVLPSAFGPHHLKLSAVDEMGCVYISDTIISINHCLDWPNCFTPNGDGVNDRFTGPVDRHQQIDNVELTIFSRWGNVIYQADAPNWDGSFNGAPVPEDVYVFCAEVRFTDGSLLTYRGDILLTR